MEKILKGKDYVNLAILNHELCGRTVTGDLNVRKCIYEEARRIFQFGEKNLEREPWKGIKAYKDDPKLIQSQVEKYSKD